MTAPARTKPVTAEELRQIPDDGFRYELVNGELRQMTPAGHTHGRIAVNVTLPLAQHVRANNLGTTYAAETGFQIATNPDTVRAPGVAFVRPERVEAVEDTEGFWPGAPDLAVKVISPNDTYTQIEKKVIDWLDAGTRMVIVVNPQKRTATVYRSPDSVRLLTETDTIDCGDVVRGWTLPVADIFA